MGRGVQEPGRRERPAAKRDPVSVIRARYPGRCDYCGDAVTPGDEVLYARGSRTIWCSACSRRARWIIAHGAEFREAEEAPPGDPSDLGTPDCPWVPLCWQIDADGQLIVLFR